MEEFTEKNLSSALKMIIKRRCNFSFMKQMNKEAIISVGNAKQHKKDTRSHMRHSSGFLDSTFSSLNINSEDEHAINHYFVGFNSGVTLEYNLHTQNQLIHFAKNFKKQKEANVINQPLIKHFNP